MKNEAVTVGIISRETGISVFNVQYILRSRGIEPIQWAGRIRVYGDDVIDRVRREHQSMHRGRVVAV